MLIVYPNILQFIMLGGKSDRKKTELGPNRIWAVMYAVAHNLLMLVRRELFNGTSWRQHLKPLRLAAWLIPCRLVKSGRQWLLRVFNGWHDSLSASSISSTTRRRPEAPPPGRAKYRTDHDVSQRDGSSSSTERRPNTSRPALRSSRFGTIQRAKTSSCW